MPPTGYVINGKIDTECGSYMREIIAQVKTKIIMAFLVNKKF